MNESLIKKLQETDLFKPPTKAEVKAREEARPLDTIDACFGALVGLSGACKTVEGELVRAITKIHYRYSNDGDYFYKGYGKETAGAPYRFLKAKAGELGIPALTIALRAAASSRETEEQQFTEESPYQAALLAAEKAIVDYIVSKNKKFTPNKENMLNY